MGIKSLIENWKKKRAEWKVPQKWHTFSKVI